MSGGTVGHSSAEHLRCPQTGSVFHIEPQTPRLLGTGLKLVGEAEDKLDVTYKS